MSDWIVVRCTGLSEAELDGELLGLHVEQGTCYGFNGTATRIWKMIEQPRRVSELCNLLVSEFDVESDVCERDLRALLRDLEQSGLVSIDTSVP